MEAVIAQVMVTNRVGGGLIGVKGLAQAGSEV